MAKKVAFAIIENPNKILEKISVVPGGNSARLLAQANKAVDAMGDDFKKIYDAEVKRTYADISKIRKEPDDAEDAWKDLRACLHDLRGQAGTFGYPLASKVSDSACKFMDRVRATGAPETIVVGMHID